MVLLALLLLTFLNSCGIIHIEIRDRKPSSQPQAPPLRKEVKEEPAKPPLKSEELLRVRAPVKGKATRTERGYYINTGCGEFFRSVSDGRVLYVGDDVKGYGWLIMVDGEKGFVFVYAKAELSLVKRGERVRVGQPLGKVGSSKEGCGLLFEIRNLEGRPVSFELVL